MPPKKHRAPTCPPGVGRRHIIDTYGSLPSDFVCLRNGHIIFMYHISNANNASQTQIELCKKYQCADNLNLKSSIRLVLVQKNKFQKLTNSNALEKFKTFCNETFKLSRKRSEITANTQLVPKTSPSQQCSSGEEATTINKSVNLLPLKTKQSPVKTRNQANCKNCRILNNSLKLSHKLNTELRAERRNLLSKNGEVKKWDLVSTHDSVAILLYHTVRKAFIFVKQFRPAVYVSLATLQADDTFDTTVYPGSIGITHELCAGIMDKDKTEEETAREEVLEECGYRVPPEGLQRITSCRSGVGTQGAKQTLFYTRVDDTMRDASLGGGNAEEGELIDTIEVPIDEGRTFLMDETKHKPTGLMFALMWFYDVEYKNIDHDRNVEAIEVPKS